MRARIARDKIAEIYGAPDSFPIPLYIISGMALGAPDVGISENAMAEEATLDGTMAPDAEIGRRSARPGFRDTLAASRAGSNRSTARPLSVVRSDPDLQAETHP